MTRALAATVALTSVVASACGSPHPAGSSSQASKGTPTAQASPSPTAGSTVAAEASSPVSPASVTGLSATNPPSGRGWASIAYDPASQKMILFGGASTTGQFHEFPHEVGDMWSWDGHAWSQLQAGPLPAGRWGGGMITDSARHVVVLHGGSNTSQTLADTWTWNGSRWTQMSPVSSPPASYGGQPAAYDGHLGEAVVFDFIGPSSLYNDPGQLWAWDGQTWNALPANNPPQSRNCCFGAIAYDPVQRATIFYSDSQAGGQPTTWSFDGSGWSRAATAGSASQEYVMATDEHDSDVVLFGSTGDTWTWDGSKWTAQNPDHAPPARKRAAIAYDPVHKIVLLFGGLQGEGAAAKDLNDLWAWNGRDWTQLG